MHIFRSDQWPTTVHPFCDHGYAFASLLTRMSHLWTTIPSVASVWLLWTRSILHSDHGVYGEAWTPCASALNNQCKFRPQFCLQWRADHLYDHNMETQTYHSLCIEDFNKIYHINPPIQGTLYVCPLFYSNSESIDYLMMSQTCICSTSRTSSSTLHNLMSWGQVRNTTEWKAIVFNRCGKTNLILYYSFDIYCMLIWSGFY